MFSPVKSPNTSPLYSMPSNSGCTSLQKSPRTSKKKHSPATSLSPKASPILDQPYQFNYALCNSPAELETSPLDIQGTIEFSNIIKESDVLVYRGFNERAPKNSVSKTSIYRFGLAPLEAIEESSGEERGKPKLKTIIHRSIQLHHNKSQHFSPRPGMDHISITKSKLHKEKKKKSNFLIALQKSPYSEVMQLSPQRLPNLKNSDKTMKAVKSFRALKRKNSLKD